MKELPLREAFEPRYGEAIEIADGIRRITAPNRSAFTFHGTNTYLVGHDELAVIDPGPKDQEAHLDAILSAAGGTPIRKIIVTHTHMDHSPLAMALKKRTGAETYAEGRHRAARDLHMGEINSLDASGDKEFEPDQTVRNGEKIKIGGMELEAVFTPGHTANHMAFALPGSDYLFSGDHVMAWATTIVAPPDGNMNEYMASLEVLLDRPETIYLPGHGGKLQKARDFVRGLRAHRRMRETAILDRIRKGDRTIPEIVSVIYRETDKRLHGAAALSVFAHLEDLVAKGLVASDGVPSLNTIYEPRALHN